MAIEQLVGHFRAVADPRRRRKVEHPLTDILVIAVCAVIACAESWNDIALYGRSKLAWLRTFLELPNGIPSHDTFRRVFMLIDPQGSRIRDHRLSVMQGPAISELHRR